MHIFYVYFVKLLAHEYAYSEKINDCDYLDGCIGILELGMLKKSTVTLGVAVTILQVQLVALAQALDRAVR